MSGWKNGRVGGGWEGMVVSAGDVWGVDGGVRCGWGGWMRGCGEWVDLVGESGEEGNGRLSAGSNNIRPNYL